MNLQIKISPQLREECVKLFGLCEQFDNPTKLRGFVDSVRGGEYVAKCIDKKDYLDLDELISKLLRNGRTLLEPALFNLLDLLAERYEGDEKGQRFKDLKEQIRKEIPQPEDPDQAGDYQRLVQSDIARGESGTAERARRWVEAAGDNLDELTLRIALAVFSGTSFAVIEAAKRDLLELLRQDQSPDPEKPPPPPPVIPMPLSQRLQEAEASEVETGPPDWKIVVELLNPGMSGEALQYVWRQYRERGWRQKLVEWLTSYVTNHPTEVRTRAAVAAGRLAVKDYRSVRDSLLDPWVRAKDRPAEHRSAVGMALGVLAREEKWVGEVQNLLRQWTRSNKREERWAAARAYIYVGEYCRPVSEAIANWRTIAASEAVTIEVRLSNTISVGLPNPLHMSLVDAMLQFFSNISQAPEGEEKQLLFKGVLDGLRGWMAAEADDAYLGILMFTILGRMTVDAEGEAQAEPPVLLQLLDEDSGGSRYRERLAELLNLMLYKVGAVTEVKDLLGTWLAWVDDAMDEAPEYEARIQSLLKEMAAADTTGGTRKQLTAYLQDYGHLTAAGRALASM